MPPKQQLTFVDFMLAVVFLSAGLLRTVVADPIVRPKETSDHAAAPQTANDHAATSCDPSKFKIAIDVGHTIEAPGAISARGVTEYVFNLRLSNVTNDLIGKWLELLKQVAPGVNLVAVLWEPDSMPDRAREVRLKSANASAQAFGVQLQVVEALGPADLDRAFLDISASGASALVVLTTPIFGIERQRIADLAAKNRLPTVYASRNYVDVGGLMSYGPNVADLHRRAASYVDKILKGAKPSDLPVEQPTKFEFVINLKTANALGLTVP